MPNALKCVVQVSAGLIVGMPRAEFSKQWTFDSATYAKMQDGDPEAAMAWASMMEESREYTESLENPGLLNWVIRSWIWL